MPYREVSGWMVSGSGVYPRGYSYESFEYDSGIGSYRDIPVRGRRRRARRPGCIFYLPTSPRITVHVLLWFSHFWSLIQPYPVFIPSPPLFPPPPRNPRVRNPRRAPAPSLSPRRRRPNARPRRGRRQPRPSPDPSPRRTLSPRRRRPPRSCRIPRHPRPTASPRRRRPARPRSRRLHTRRRGGRLARGVDGGGRDGGVGVGVEGEEGAEGEVLDYRELGEDLCVVHFYHALFVVSAVLPFEPPNAFVVERG